MDSADIHYSCLVSLIYKSLLFGSIYQLPLADPTFRGMYREQKLNQNCVGPRITTYLNPRYSRFSFPSNQSIGSRYWLGVANSKKKGFNFVLYILYMGRLQRRRHSKYICIGAQYGILLRTPVHG